MIKHSELFELEKSFFDAAVRRNVEQLKKRLSDDFIEYGASGKVYDKAAVVASLSSTAPQIDAFDFAAKELAPNLVQVLYKTHFAAGPVNCLRSSLWRLEGGEWKLFFHQATRT